MTENTPREPKAERKLEHLAPSSLIPNPRNARKHPKKQIAKIKRAIREFGFTAPILIDEHGNVLAGHGRLAAAHEMKLKRVPCIRLAGLTEQQKKALAISDNRLGDESEFDRGLLAAIFAELELEGVDTELTGFDTGAIDAMVMPPFELSSSDPADAPVDTSPAAAAVTRPGDLWRLGTHRLFCGNSREGASYDALLAGERAQFVLGDPPYNVPINGHVSGSGRHREFAQASGEMSSADFTSFLGTVMSHLTSNSSDGSIHALFMDWRHISEITEAGKHAYTSLLNVCVWDKQSPSLGSMYRSQHELVFVFKHGLAPHINNINLGAYGRTRSNVWSYPGLSGFGRGRDEALAAHPTCKSVMLVADAIRDCSKRNGLVLDPFAGSGTTIIAAERTHRRAAAIEIDPLYCDVAVRRWQALT